MGGRGGHRFTFFQELPSCLPLATTPNLIFSAKCTGVHISPPYCQPSLRERLTCRMNWFHSIPFPSDAEHLMHLVVSCVSLEQCRFKCLAHLERTFSSADFTPKFPAASGPRPGKNEELVTQCRSLVGVAGTQILGPTPATYLLECPATESWRRV